MAFPRLKSARDRIAELVREQLPWASVISGASGCRFIKIDRGETISGHSERTDSKGKYLCGSVWSRPVVGSRRLLWDADEFDPPVIMEEIAAHPGEVSREVCIKQCSADSFPALNPKTFSVVDAAAILVAVADNWLRPVPPEEIAAQLRDGERFEHLIYKVKP